jgi:membrane protease YdiL (CAAX protease family)
MISKHVRRIVTATIIGTIIVLVSNALSALNVGVPPSAIVELSVLFLSLLAILILSKGHISEYGFQKPRNVKWARMILIALVLGALLTLTGVLSGSSGMPESKQFSFPQIVLIVWLLARVAEEILTRGLIQGYLSPLNEIKVKLLSPLQKRLDNNHPN